MGIPERRVGGALSPSGVCGTVAEASAVRRLCQPRVKGATRRSPNGNWTLPASEPRVPCAPRNVSPTAARSRLQRRTREWFAVRRNRGARAACPFVPLEPVPVACPSSRVLVVTRGHWR